jgi:hypothetical protein
LTAKKLRYKESFLMWPLTPRNDILILLIDLGNTHNKSKGKKQADHSWKISEFLFVFEFFKAVWSYFHLWKTKSTLPWFLYS